MAEVTARSWGSMARTARAPILILLLGGLGLTVPPQTRDMLAFGSGRIWAWVAFQLALFILAFYAWFWARAALAARFSVDDRQREWYGGPPFDWSAFVWLPRLILLAAFVVGAIIAAISRSWYSVGAAAVLAAAALGLAIVRPRATRSRPVTQLPRGGLFLWLRYGIVARLRALLERAPFGPAFAGLVLFVSLVPLGLGLVEAFTSTLDFPHWLALAFPGPAVAVLLLALMIGPLTVVTFVSDGLRMPLGLRRPPILILLALYVFAFVPAIFAVHTVRIIPDPRHAVLASDPGQEESVRIKRATLDAIFTQWVKACAPDSGPVRPVIVAVSGGATRAGLWGAAVLDRVLQAQAEGRTGAKLFAVSSVSGGSLGVAGAMSVMRDERQCATSGLPSLRADQGRAPLAGDALGPLLAGWLANDVPRATFEPLAALIRKLNGRFPNGGDSAEAIERAFEHLWDEVRPAGSLAWSGPFLTLFYTEEGQYRPGMPIWIANGTDAATGNRVLTSPIAPPGKADDETPWPFRGARDLIELMDSDVPISTAINNTARFPYLEPFGTMRRRGTRKQVGSLIDGGYFENEGMQTALDLADWLQREGNRLTGGREVEPIIVQATGDGEVKVTDRDIMTCGRASDGPWIASKGRALPQLLAPLAGLYHVRGGHSAVLLREAKDEHCPGRFFHFYLPGRKVQGHPREAVPLNWVLSNDMAQFIWTDAFADRPVKNESEWNGLRAALRAAQ